MNPSMSLIQNGDWYGRYYSQYAHAAMSHYLALFGLDENRRFGSLSKGEKLKCQFAFALSHHASLLLLDEPAGNFDPGFREQFLQMIREFVQDGTRSVILATHITQDLDRMADYILYLENGTSVFAGDIERLHEQYRIVSGEAYKIKLLPKEKLIYMEENQYGAKALIAHSRLNRYDASLKVSYPTIEELMYFYARRKIRIRRAYYDKVYRPGLFRSVSPHKSQAETENGMQQNCFIACHGHREYRDQSFAGQLEKSASVWTDTVQFLAVLLPLCFSYFSMAVHPVQLSKMMYLCPMNAKERSNYIYGSYFFRIAIQMSIGFLGLWIAAGSVSWDFFYSGMDFNKSIDDSEPCEWRRAQWQPYACRWRVDIPFFR